MNTDASNSEQIWLCSQAYASGEVRLGLGQGHVKPVVLFCALCLAFSACRHAEPQPQVQTLSTDTEIRENIVGEWTSRDGAFGYPKIIISADGKLFGVSTNEAKELIGTWNYEHHALRVAPSKARMEEARASGYHLDAWDWFPIEHADAHELIMTPSTSVAGRWTFTK